MEAIIRTNDKSIFNPLVRFLKSLHIEVETKTIKKKPKTTLADLTAVSLKEISSLSEEKFSTIWDNEPDAVYDRFLK
ncbi:MAG: toxin-antitoxin system, antitoxin component, Xre family protein [Cytophagales bacterium]|nr:toxin-antitoxin system, antitoxin component, Xre family protein [Cytophagales bacterium]